ncbi:MAG: DUF11 domain-containing protein [Actinobacteria bacterium]|nr:DUF11 domain-containing protein [Actinomycetota bacterium]
MRNRTVVGAMVLSLLLILSPAGAQTEPKPPEGGTSQGTTDLAVQATGPGGIPLVGDTFDLVFSVTNNGPEAAPDSTFSTYLSQGLSFISATSSDATDTCSVETYAYAPSMSEAYVTCDLGQLGTGGATTLTVTVRRDAAREIYAYGSVWTSAQETNYDNDYSEIFIPADQSQTADLALQMTGPTGEVTGDFAYKLKVNNEGPETSSGVWLTDYLPDGVDLISATSSDPSDVCTVSSSGGGTDPAKPMDGGGSPDFYRQQLVSCDLGSLDAGSTKVVTLRVTRTSGWEIWNSASVSSASYDPNYENDYADFHIGADPSVTSDVNVDVDLAPGVPLVGEQARLVFNVKNFGPSTAGDLFLANYIPEGLEFVSFQTQRAGDSCGFQDYSYKDQAPYAAEPGSPESSGSADSASSPIYYGGSSFDCGLASLASRESTSITLVVRRTGAREIYDYVSVYSSNYDPNYEDNYAEVLIPADKSQPADVSIGMTAPENPDVGSRFDYNLTVTNEGPSTASKVQVADPLPWGVDFVGATSSDGTDVCEFTDYEGYDEPRAMESSPSFYGYRELRCDLGDLAAGETTDITLSVTRSTEYEVWNSAYVTSSSYDENYDNDYAYAAIKGEPAYGTCDGGSTGTDGSDDIVVDDCFVEAGAGADQVEMFAGSSSVDRSIVAGRGADQITVNVPSGSSVEREIKVDGGRGADTINVVVGPGATNVTVVIYGRGQADSLNLDIAPTAGNVRIVFKGGPGKDTARSLRYSETARPTIVRLRGGPGTDMLLGTNNADLILGGRGSDHLDGGAGADTLDGGKGVDVCRDGPGADLVRRC